MSTLASPTQSMPLLFTLSQIAAAREYSGRFGKALGRRICFDSRGNRPPSSGPYGELKC
jgi:hypothetical protein